MGAGAALAVKKKYKSLSKMFGSMLLGNDSRRIVKIFDITGNVSFVYGIVPAYVNDKIIVAFQTKIWRKNPAHLGIINQAARELGNFLTTLRNNETVSIAFPGIELGGLNPSEVIMALDHYLDQFKNNIYVCSL